MDHVPAPPILPQPRRVGPGRALVWWAEGWRSFVAAPLAWIGLTLAFIVALGLVHSLPLGTLLLKLALPPLLTFGILFAARLAARRAAAPAPLPGMEFGGTPVGVVSFEGTIGEAAGAWSASLGRLLLASLLAWLLSWVALAAIMLVAMLAGAGIGGLAALGPAMMGGPAMMTGAGVFAGVAAVSVGGMVAMLLALFMAWALSGVFWFLWPLVALGGLAPWPAAVLSWRAFLANFWTIVLFDLLFFALLAVVMLTMGLGVFVLAPMAAAASYASYTDVFGGSQPG